jgi:hypothetical protein
MADPGNQFDQRQEIDAPDVDARDHESNGTHQQCAMPTLIYVRVWVVKHHETLYLSCEQIIETCCRCLPREYGDPA